MKNFELYIGLKKKRAEYGDVIESAKKEISKLEIEKEDLGRELLRLEALGDRGVDSAQKRVKTNEDALLVNQAAVEKGMRAIDTIEKEKIRVRPAALEEIKAEYRGRLEKALRNFLVKLRAAADAELEAIEIRTEAVRTAAQIDVDEMRCGLPIIDHVVVEQAGSGGSLIGRFIQDCKAQGMPVD